MDFAKLMERYGSEERCRDYLEDLRWPDGIRCPRCNSEKVSRIHKRGQFDCDSCRYQFSVTSGTILHDSHLPLWKWFLAVYILGESKKGISSNQLKRMLGTSYKTAWYLSHRIRAAMRDEYPEQLRGIVEVDETYLTPRDSRSIGRSPVGKQIIVGAVERGGRVRLKVTQRVDKKALHGFVNAVVADEAKEIHTDAWWGYRGLGDEDTAHRVVNHTETWVQADVHTNTIEGVWSLFKRSLVGSYHHLSARHLPAYLDEMAFRYNNRSNAYLFRDTLLRLIEAEAKPYRELVATA
jgi:transposase-like protein